MMRAHWFTASSELTGKRHDNVMADIRSMLEALGFHAPEFSGTYQTERGNTYECFNLPKDLTTTLVSGYSIPMRHRIVTRWMELEQAGPRVPTSFREALLLAAEQQERIEAPSRKP